MAPPPRSFVVSSPLILTPAGPIPDGAVLVDPAGRIAAIGPAAELDLPTDIHRERFPGVLIPGLVNLHTHLELTGLAGRVVETAFPDWIRALRAAKADRDPEQVLTAAREGVRDAFAAGITTVADTGDSGTVLPALAREGGAGVAYQEVFGPHPDQAVESLARLEARLSELEAYEGPRLRLGISPHAPYTVSGPLYRAAAALARRLGRPLAVHLAESREETSFVARGAGPFAEAWRGRGIPPLEDHLAPGAGPGARRSPVAWLDAHGVLGFDTLCIHTVQLDPADVSLLTARNAAIAHCPVSNARHGHGAAPLRSLVDAGLRVGVGTDSVVSVGRLDLFAELRAARALAGLTARDTLGLATREAARALALEAETGRLAVGYWADLVALDVMPEPGTEPEEAVLAAGPERILATFASGRERYRAARPA